jgi:hypothetical protein
MYRIGANAIDYYAAHVSGDMYLKKYFYNFRPKIINKDVYRNYYKHI